MRVGAFAGGKVRCHVAIQVTCAVCGKKLAAPDTAAGMPGKCPNCGELVRIPGGPSASPAASTAPVVQARAVQDEATKRCPYCAETIKAAAVKCRFCGSMLGSGAPPTSTVPTRMRPSEGEIVCPNPNCGFCGLPTKKRRGSIIVMFFLLLLGALPGLIYAIVYDGYTLICPQCGMRLGTTAR